MKILNSKIHGILDIAMIVLFWSAPALFDFTGAAATISRTMGSVHLGIVLLTAYPFGLINAIPFTVHGAIEFLVSIGLVFMPWLAGFADVTPAKIYFVSSGIGLFAVWLLTDYSAEPPYGTSRAYIEKELERPMALTG